jgi:hypothetical protein
VDDLVVTDSSEETTRGISWKDRPLPTPAELP